MGLLYLYFTFTYVPRLPISVLVIVLFYQLDVQILYFNTFITFLYMFRALLCTSSGGQIVLVQRLVSSLF